MTATKIRDVIARLPDCDGQAADAVSISLHSSNIGGCSQIAQNFENQNVQTYRNAFHDTSGPKWANVEDPVLPLERNLCGHPLAALLGERQFEEVLLGLGWEKSAELGMYSCSWKTEILLVGDDIKIV